MNSSIEQVTNGTSNDRVRLRYRFGDKEIEVEGLPTDVKELAKMWFSQMSRGVETLPDVASISTDAKAKWVSDETNQVSEQQTEITKMSPSELISFFRQKSPNGQKEEVVTITYFYQKVLGRENLTLEDYEEAFAALRRLAVAQPNNMKSSVRNVVDRTNLLYTPDRGRFALTLQGEQFVEQMEERNASEN